MNFEQLAREVAAPRFKKQHSSAAFEAASSLLSQARKDRTGTSMDKLLERIHQVMHSREFFDTGEQIVLRAATNLLSYKMENGATAMPAVQGASGEIRRAISAQIAADVTPVDIGSPTPKRRARP